jgi:ubiquinone/menaquinone biosynthesis C-methylase UbiE
MTSTVGTFDTLADAYQAFRTGYSETLVEQVVSYGQLAGTAVLDVACGTGISTAAFAAKGCVMTGLDPSAPMLAHARAALPNARFQEGRAEAIPFADKVFRGALCAQAMHWMDQPRAIAEMTRVVVPGGIVAIWWKVLANDDRMRAYRAAAARSLGLPPDSAKTMPSGFTAFYAAPFAKRELRVLPYSVRPSVRECLGYETSRANANEMYGDRRDEYFAALEREMVAGAGSLDARVHVSYMQYLYVGFVA